MNSINVSIIIVNYNTQILLKQCIESIQFYTKDLIYEIIVIDNASTDESIAMLSAYFPSVKVIKNSKNVGFGRANNLGANLAQGKYLFFLNSDTLLLNNAVKYFYDYFEDRKREDIKAAGAWLLDETKHITHSYGFFQTKESIIKEMRFRMINRLKEKYPSKGFERGTKARQVEVDYITGADLFMLRDIFFELGGFHKDFFMYYEETYLQYLMKLKNYKRVIINGPQIMHLCGKSNTNFKKKKLMFDKSLILYLRKTERGALRCFKISYIFYSTFILIKNRVNFIEIVDYCNQIIRS